MDTVPLTYNDAVLKVVVPVLHVNAELHAETGAERKKDPELVEVLEAEGRAETEAQAEAVAET